MIYELEAKKARVIERMFGTGIVQVSGTDPRLQKMADLISKGWGSSSFKHPIVRELVETIVGSTLPQPTPPRPKFEPGTVIVIQSNPNRHNYPIGIPCIVLGNGAAALYNGSVPEGAFIPADYTDAVRKATVEEVTQFFMLAGSCIEDAQRHLATRLRPILGQ